MFFVNKYFVCTKEFYWISKFANFQSQCPFFFNRTLTHIALMHAIEKRNLWCLISIMKTSNFSLSAVA